MRLRTVLGELLPVMGTVGLLGLWLFQQTGIEARNSELRKLSAAHAVFQNYLSVSPLFDAFLETTDRSKQAYEKIGLLQAYNFEAGLQIIEEALPSSAKHEIIPGALDPYGSATAEEKHKAIQARSRILLAKLVAYEVALADEAERARVRYFAAYICISIITILGAIIKAVDKIFPAAPYQPRPRTGVTR